MYLGIFGTIIRKMLIAVICAAGRCHNSLPLADDSAGIQTDISRVQCQGTAQELTGLESVYGDGLLRID